MRLERIICKGEIKLIVAENLKKIYGKENEVIKGVNITIVQGEFVVITGKSGSGKSTLLYLLSGLEIPTGGGVKINGVDINKLNDKEISKLRRKKIGFVFQFYNLVPSLTVIENILLPLEIDGQITNIKKDYVMSIVEMLGLQEKQNEHVYNLSGGQQQRVAIARALAIEPEIIFADEPTGNLDTYNSKEVMSILKRLNNEYKTTIVMVTHDEKIAPEYATREIVIQNGKIIHGR
ncbi:MAG: ABC transporter ATP-binding protein [Eubacterium sp.]|nr:ABC transporter ATP-binding protein [Eubacterium sp.]